VRWEFDIGALVVLLSRPIDDETQYSRFGERVVSVTRKRMIGADWPFRPLLRKRSRRWRTSGLVPGGFFENHHKNGARFGGDNPGHFRGKPSLSSWARGGGGLE